MNKELLKKLTQAYGPSGCEGGIVDIIKKEIKPYVTTMSVDVLGNLIAVKKGNAKGKKIMTAAHMDEIGVMVTTIDEKGFLRFTPIGGVNAITAKSQRVVFANETVGTIGCDKLDSVKDLEIRKLYIDIGAKDKAAAEKLVSVGDTAVFTSSFETSGDYVMTKALDDRLGCYVAIEAAKALAKTDNEIYFTFTVQEEVGCRGAKTSGYQIDPDLAIALDVTSTGDTPNAHPMAVSLGAGTAIKVRDNGILVSTAIKNLMIDTCKKNKIKYQLEVLEGGSTDAAAIQVVKSGVPAGVISIPTRYVHSPSEMASISDIEASVKLLVKLLEA